MLIRLGVAAVITLGLVGGAVAAPSRIIILRHGEKADDWRLCEVGQQRAQALKLNYLGKDAAKSLFEDGEPPAYFFAITLHTAELAAPAVQSWNKPLIFYSALPQDSEKVFVDLVAARTREAAANILTNPALKGKTVVMVWEHHHIADAELDAKHEGDAAVTLRQLFNLDILPGVPKTWPEETFDYFWIVDFPDNSNVPSKFTMMKQEFGTSFPNVPANDWGEPDGLDAASGCVAKSKD
ncbi:MAG: histidine phosphatase family protein [Methyloceanibacter sp.]|uniref:histidine phosphatase family protein n=1 Tax=Methyloceanibacter sp. TaxID=1965321 RepID=UPI003D6D754D